MRLNLKICIKLGSRFRETRENCEYDFFNFRGIPKESAQYLLLSNGKVYVERCCRTCKPLLNDKRNIILLKRHAWNNVEI